MDLSYSKEEVAFRQEVRDFFRTAVPPETRKRLQEGRHLGKQNMVEWQRIQPNTLDAGTHTAPTVPAVRMMVCPISISASACYAASQQHIVAHTPPNQ